VTDDNTTLDSETLPCGCVISRDVVDGVNTVTFIPHSLSCKYYKWLLAEGARQGKPTTIIDAR
jgi:hypothetical protein